MYMESSCPARLFLWANHSSLKVVIEERLGAGGCTAFNRALHPIRSIDAIPYILNPRKARRAVGSDP